MHIVIGDGGNREGLAEVYDEPQPDWSAYREASYGSGTLDLLNTTHALWRWHRNQDSQAIVSDEVGPAFLRAAEPFQVLAHVLHGHVSPYQSGKSYG